MITRCGWRCGTTSRMQQQIMREGRKEGKGTPCEEDVVAVLPAQPGAEDREGLHTLAEGRPDGHAVRVGRTRSHAGLRAIAVVHVEVQQRHPLHACAAVRPCEPGARDCISIGESRGSSCTQSRAHQRGQWHWQRARQGQWQSERPAPWWRWAFRA